jgi:hypothetical protein
VIFADKFSISIVEGLQSCISSIIQSKVSAHLYEGNEIFPGLLAEDRSLTGQIRRLLLTIIIRPL